MATTERRADRVTSWPRAEVAEFDRGRDDILVVERSPIPEVSAAMTAARVREWWCSRVTPGDVGAWVSESLADLNLDCPPLAADVSAVALDFLAQFGADRASLRVEAATDTSCPKFHCDNVRVRLVTTYHGPATEYVRGGAQDDIRQATTGSLVFLKGHLHPTHADTVLHRSPAVPPGGKRLVVVLDI